MNKRAAIGFGEGLKRLDALATQRLPAPASEQPSAPMAAPDNPPPAAPRASRAGRVNLSFWVDPAVRRQIHQLALDKDTTQGAMIAEALNLLFAEYGKPTIAKA